MVQRIMPLTNRRTQQHTNTIYKCNERFNPGCQMIGLLTTSETRR